jgi:hypothetical protein
VRRLHRHHTHRILTEFAKHLCPANSRRFWGCPPGTWPMRLPRCDQINVAQAARFQFRRTDLSDKMKRPVETRQRRLDWPDPATGGDQWSRLPGVYHTKKKERWRSAGHAIATSNHTSDRGWPRRCSVCRHPARPRWLARCAYVHSRSVSRQNQAGSVRQISSAHVARR